MKGKLPYEESLEKQLNDLPLPDEEQSWQKMKLLLEDDDDDRIIPPIFLRGCIGWSLLFFALLLIFWLIVHPEKWWEKKDISKTGTSKENTQNKTSGTIKESSTKTDSIYKGQPKKTNSSPVEIKSPGGISKKITKDQLFDTPDNQQIKHKQKDNNINPIGFRKTSNQTAKANKIHKPSSRINIKPPTKRDKNQIAVDIVGSVPVTKKGQSDAEKNQIPEKSSKQKDTVVKRDSIIKKDSVIKDSIVMPVVKEENKKNKKTNKHYASAGLGLQQQIPLAGQEASPYNYYGRRGSLADYVPSVYVRLHRENKWFIQGEFRFGAPQSVKELAYEQISVTDTSGTRTTTRTLRLKKTFYHQVPFSFNYQLIPNLTIGAGGMYSKFYRAIIEDELVQKNNQTVTVLNKEIKPVYKNDSLQYFTNSQIYLQVQANYQWKKFSFGLSYARGLQPFIKYTDTNGALMEEKNHSLQFAVRYRLWQSK